MKTKVIFIYGAPAAGKLTTAKALSEITGFKVFHNHLSTDLVRSLFERGNVTGDTLIVRLRLELLELAVKEGIDGIILTGVYAHDFVYANGKTDDWYVTELERIVESNGGEFYGVQLVTSKETLLKRVVETDRQQWKKIHSTEVLEQALEKHDHTQPAPLKNNLVIDNTNTPAHEVAKQICAFAGVGTTSN
jgi:dephospho-CoA kinase